MEKKKVKRRIVLVPVPAQGHVTRMMQLGQALNLKGFPITVVQGHFNQVRSSSQHFPGFQFVTIKESLPESELGRLGPIEFLIKLNKTREASFKDCLAKLLRQQGNIACVIYDEYMYFCGAATKEFKLPSVILSTSSATNQVSRCVLSKFNAQKFVIDMEDSEVQDMMVENVHPLRYKDLPSSGVGPLEKLFELCREIVNTRTAFVVIINSVCNVLPETYLTIISFSHYTSCQKLLFLTNSNKSH